MTDFFIDERQDVHVTYEELLQNVGETKCIPKYIRSDKSYDMLRDLFLGMLCGAEMVLLDSDFSEEELSGMGISTEELDTIIEIPQMLIPEDVQKAIEKIGNTPWKLWMFTSGTTGLPKRVCHTFQTLARNVRRGKRHENDVWALAYRLSHMAGIQVFLQSLLNGNPMVYVFESSPKDAVEAMRNHHCTHISATPTFYRNLLPFLKNSLPDLRHATLGGEKYDKDLCEKLTEILPEAKIHNIYASTETGSILNASGDGFEIPKDYCGKVKISDENELLVHASLLGEFPMEGEWYNTHDLVEEREGKIYFLSRKSDLLNVGGYKVNPLEVEEAMQGVAGISDCLVKGQKNSVLGTVLVAEILRKDGYSDKDIKKAVQQELRGKLQPFKIPRIFQFVDRIEKTRSGKKVRK